MTWRIAACLGQARIARGSYYVPSPGTQIVPIRLVSYLVLVQARKRQSAWSPVERYAPLQMLPSGGHDGSCVNLGENVVEARGGGVSDFRGAKVSATANENADGAYGYVFSHLSHTSNHGWVRRAVLEPCRMPAAA